MLGFKGFERDLVGLVSAFVKRDVFVLSVMRLVSRTWRAGCEQQWKAVQRAVILDPERNISIFETNDELLKSALLYVFMNNKNVAVEIMKARFADVLTTMVKDMGTAQIEQSEQDEDCFYFFTLNTLIRAAIFFEVVPGLIRVVIRNSGSIRILFTPSSFVDPYKVEQFLCFQEPQANNVVELRALDGTKICHYSTTKKRKC
jgi:hypothetical protein